MTHEEIDILLSAENNEALKAHSEIVTLQKDKTGIIRLGQDWLDKNLIGGLNNKIVFLGSRPAGGKTFHCSSTINNLLNKEINPLPIEILRFNLEMPTSTLLLREISKVLGKKPSEILKEPYLEEDKPKVSKVVNSFMDKRVTNVSAVLKGEEYRYAVNKFLKKVDEKDEVFNQEQESVGEEFTPRKTKKIILLDHLHIYLSKEIIDTILAIQNDIKMSDTNVSFLNYFQLNRMTEDLWRNGKDAKINPKNMLPNSTSIYLTDILQQVGDLVAGMVIPQVYDLDEFCAVNKERNKHLVDHFSEDTSDNTYVRLKGRNRIYYNLIKVRMLDSFDDPRLFCEILNPAYEEQAKKIMEENKKPFTKIQTPTFSATPVPIFEPSFPKPNFELNQAFDLTPTIPNSSEEDVPF